MLQETHLTDTLMTNENRLFHGKLTITANGTNRSKWTAILTKAPKYELESLNIDKGRITYHDIANPLPTRVISVYSPNLHGTIAARNIYKEHISKLSRVIGEASQAGKEVIVMGDLNTIFNPHIDTVSGHPTREREIVDEWDTLMMTHVLTDAFRYYYPEKRTYSFAPQGANERGIFRRLDHALVSQGILHKIKSIRYKDTTLSDHRALTMELLAEEAGRKSARLWRHKDHLLKLEGYREDIKEEARKAVEEAEAEVEDKRARWEYIKY